MKNTHFIFLIFFSSFLYSQSTIGKFRAGITGGLTVSDINGADTRDTDNDFHKIGVVGGFLVNTNISKKDVLQMEINYIRCGSLQPPDSLNNGYYNISLSYIDIPVVIRHRVIFTVRKKPVDKIDLEAGLSFSRLLTERVIGSSNNVIYNNTQYYNNNIANLILGADYNFSNNFYFCLRYSNGLIPAIKRNPLRLSTINYTFNKGNNMIFYLSVKYLFEGKKTENRTNPEVQ